MLELASPFILWPIGIALGGLLCSSRLRSARAELILCPVVSRLDQRR